jgi:cytochrome c oxidase cbb3-type subunit I/II
MFDPRSTSPGSIMPRYPWLLKNNMNASNLEDKMTALAKLGVPYSDTDISEAKQALLAQAKEIETSLRQDPEFVKNYGNSNVQQKEIVALIAYLQRLGTDIKAGNTALK